MGKIIQTIIGSLVVFILIEIYKKQKYKLLAWWKQAPEQQKYEIWIINRTKKNRRYKESWVTYKQNNDGYFNLEYIPAKDQLITVTEPKFEEIIKSGFLVELYKDDLPAITEANFKKVMQCQK